VIVLFLMFQLVDLPALGANTPAATPAEGEYEIDYEEEEGASVEAAPEVADPSPSKSKKRTVRNFGSGPAVQGSRAKNRFVPILKSETKSVYQKDGKALDVDTD
jgi:hypothetical protein